LTFGGKAKIQAQDAPTIKFEIPTNESTGTAVQPRCNITAEDNNSENMDITFATNESGVWVNKQTNSSVSNGSYSWVFTDADTNNKKYWWQVYADDGTTNFTRIFQFKTEYLTSCNSTVRAVTDPEETNATCIGHMVNTSGFPTTGWIQIDDAPDFNTLVANESCGIIAEGSNFTKDITGLSNGTYYYFRTMANNTRGWNASWNFTNFLTKPQPATSVTIKNIANGFNVSWTHGNGYNTSWIVVNTTHVPADTSDGDTLDVLDITYYHHTGLTPGVTYYYRIWEYTTWGGLSQTSDGDYNESKQYEGELPVFSNENPTNKSTDVALNTYSWNVTIETGLGSTFNWTIEAEDDIGINGSDNCVNGSYNITISGNLSEGVNYTVWVNASVVGSANWTNETFWFVAETLEFTPYTTLTFGGKAEVQGEAPSIDFLNPANQSYENDMYTMLNITISDEQGQDMNVTWLYNTGSGWNKFAFNDSISSGSTVYQRATWANGSFIKYNWSVHVNDTDMKWINETYYFFTANYSWGNWSDWWEFTYSAEAPTNLAASTWNETAINLSWTNPSDGGWDTVVLLRNETDWTTYPIMPENETQIIYNGTNQTFNDTGLINGTVYYYSIYTWNNTEAEYSIQNDTAIGATQGGLGIWKPYPPNESTGNDRPPANISIHINGTNVDVYMYFMNMTPSTNTTTLFANWSGVNSLRYNFTEFNWSAPGDEVTDWIWGDTNYTWYVNVTDGVEWANETYWFKTKGSRYDVNGNTDVTTSDITEVWNHHTPIAPYNGIYDVNYNGDITTSDISIVWANHS